MNKNYFSRLTTKEKLDVIGKVVEQLVQTTDACFNLSESEKSVIVESAFSGIHQILDQRYNSLKKGHSSRRK